MQKKSTISEQFLEEERQRLEHERQELVVQTVKLPNGATFTRLRPVGA